MERNRLGAVFAELGSLVTEGVIGGYAIVGAVGAIFYAEAIRTFDLDVAVSLPEPEGAILSLTPLYDHLRGRGFLPEAEHVRIHGVPVQFLSSEPALWREAVDSARVFDYEGIPVRVAPPEHLVLMALEAPAPRRRERVALLVESGAVDREKLVALAQRHRIPLPEAWNA
jgi:hypothetical protein